MVNVPAITSTSTTVIDYLDKHHQQHLRSAFNYNYYTNNYHYNTIRPLCCGGNLWGELRGNRTAEEVSG